MDMVCLLSVSSANLTMGEREMLVINGAFPGPTIEANWGDTIQVTVHNTLQEGTTLHWHGLLQTNTVHSHLTLTDTSLTWMEHQLFNNAQLLLANRSPTASSQIFTEHLGTILITVRNISVD
jgi:FtsP/CotA-like multicopper oxidase with cupredoxin domain